MRSYVNVLAECAYVVFTYYVIRNTTGEYSRRSDTAYWNTLEKAKEDMKNHSDWWRSNGTGHIYRIDIYENADGSIESREELVYKRG